jgi:DNA-directed RNA polymerase specialized sigma24 family protein
LATTASDSQPDFQQELLAIREDPEVRRLALRRAMNPEMADDALQAVYYAVFRRVKNPPPIEDLRAYFRKTLIREIYRQVRQLRAEAPEDVTILADMRQGQTGTTSPAPRPFPEEVSIRLLGRGWLRAFTARRGELAARVPRRSGDPVRYQRLIVRVAEHMLRTILGENADADINAVLIREYAEWFATRDSSENTRHQRLLRARNDVCALLKTIVERGDLIS